MKIWILNHYAISPKSIGGTRHFDLAQELVRKGHEVRIFASSFNHFEKMETVQYTNSNFSEVCVEGVKFTWIKTPPYNNSLKRLVNIIFFTSRLNNVLNKYLKWEVPDIIIGSSVHPLTPLIGLKKSQKKKVLFYFEERDLWPQTFIDFGLLGERNIISIILFGLEKHLYKKSDRVIFLFEKAHKYALTKGLADNKHIYIPNGYSESRVLKPIVSNEVDIMLTPFTNKKLCVYTGSMGEANHMLPLMRLAKSVQNEEEYHFLFVGDGPLKHSLQKYVLENQLKNITFHHPIEKGKIPYLLSQAHCGLISMKDSPLYNWGFSMNKIYDYLSLGLPIIMYTDLNDIGKLEECGGVFYSNSIDELEKHLHNAENSDRNEIKQFASNNYSWELLTRNLLKEIEKDLYLKKS